MDAGEMGFWMNGWAVRAMGFPSNNPFIRVAGCLNPSASVLDHSFGSFSSTISHSA